MDTLLATQCSIYIYKKDPFYSTPEPTSQLKAKKDILFILFLYVSKNPKKMSVAIRRLTCVTSVTSVHKISNKAHMNSFQGF